MKRLLTISLLIVGIGLFLNNNAQAQSGMQLEIGAAYAGSYVSGGSGTIGIQGGLKYAFSDKFGATGDFTYYFPEGNADLWAINANLHYSFIAKEKTNFYALAGLNYQSSGSSSTTTNLPGGGTITTGGGSSSDVGLNIGAGAEFGLGFGNFYVEPKYVIQSLGRFGVTGGLRFSL